jgi:NAD(P)H-hydrate epimerase
MSVECKQQRLICENLGLDVIEFFNDERLVEKLLSDKGFTVIVDGIFGIGLSRSLSDKYMSIIGMVNGLGCEKVSIDIPTGICADTGQVLKYAIKADLTIAIQCEKRGTVLFPGASFAGKVITVDIGIVTIYKDEYDNLHYVFGKDDLCYAYEETDIKEYLPRRFRNSHKGTYGKVLVIAGSAGMSGAAYLAARAAYSIGVGLVQIYTPLVNRTTIQTLLPEGIVTTYDEFNQKQLEELLDWADAVCIGPGLGTGSVAEKILVHTLLKTNSPVVIDADGINLLKEHKQLLKECKLPCIITPHIKEMANFMDLSVTNVKENPLQTLNDIVASYPAICVLKDTRTLIGHGKVSFYLNTSGHNAMAKGGSGDVLAGVITGLIAPHDSLNAYAAASFGVYLHGLGGDKAKEKLGSNSVLARDIITSIEEVLRQHEADMTF